MADFISVEADLTEVMELFDGLEKGQNRIRRNILAGVGTSAKGKVKKLYKTYALKTGTGALYKSIKRKVIRSGKGVIIEATARSNKQVLYGYALAKGSAIHSKSDEYMTFQIDGKWVSLHEVKLPERDFVSEPVNDYLKSAALRNQLDRLAQREIEKLEKKGIKINEN